MTLDLNDPESRRSHVLAELQKLQGKKSQKATYTMLQCPFHSDNSPSGRVSHDTSRPRSIGWYRCYAGCCEPMPWSAFSQQLGLQPFGPPPPEMEVPKVKFDSYDGSFFEQDDELQREDLRLNDLGPQSQEYLDLPSAEWRGFSFDFLKSIGAKCAYATYHSAYYVYLPVNVNGQERGYIKALPRKPTGTKYPSYLNAPGTWAYNYGLFLFDQSINLMRKKGLTTVVITEGPRDGMRLLQAGIPAVSILGTNSWSNRKIRLLETAGVEHIVLCLDGDDAGANATRFFLTGRQAPKSEVTVTPLESAFQCTNFGLWEYEVPKNFHDKKLDPGNMPKSLLRLLSSHLT